MKNLSLFCALVLWSLGAYAQKMSTEEMIEYIKTSEYEISDNGEVVITKIVEVPETTADVIYKRAREYFTYAYGSARSVIQSDDPEGHTIIGKGLYEVPCSSLASVRAWHILRIDAKEGRARIILNLTEWERTDGISIGKPTIYYPIGDKGKGARKMFVRAWAVTLTKAYAAVDAIEKALKTDNDTKSSVSDEW